VGFGRDGQYQRQTGDVEKLQQLTARPQQLQLAAAAFEIGAGPIFRAILRRQPT
jgi:hypothetical protein